MKWESVEKGVPQGGVLSPLLANLYLHAFDQFVLSKCFYYVRYADDFIIFCSSKEQAEDMLASASSFLQERLQLQLNEPEIREVKDGIEFLGITIYPDRLGLSEKKQTELGEKIQSLNWHVDSFDAKGQKSLQGIKRYYASLLPEEYLQQFDNILEARLQEIIKKQYRLIPSQENLSLALAGIEFYSESYLARSEEIRRELLDLYDGLLSEQSQKAKDQNAQIIKQRKIEYRKKENEASELIISSKGIFVGVSQRGLTLKSYGKQQPMPPTANLQHVLIIVLKQLERNFTGSTYGR